MSYIEPYTALLPYQALYEYIDKIEQRFLRRGWYEA